MSDVQVQFSADIKDLQKGVKDAIGEVEKFGDAQKKTSDSTKKFSSAAGGAAKNVDKAAEAAAKAKKFVDGIRNSTKNATPELGGLKDAAINAAGGLVDLAGKSGVAGAGVGKLATKFLGAGGIIALADLAAEAAIQMGAALVDSFLDAERAAERARLKFKDTIEESLKIETSFESVSFSDKTGLLAAIAATQAEIDELEDRVKRSAKIQRGAFGTNVIQAEGETRQNVRTADEALLKKEKDILSVLQAQLQAYESQFEARQRAINLGAGVSVDIDTSEISIPGGDELVAPIDAATQSELDAFAQARIDLIKNNIDLDNSFESVTAALEKENEALLAQNEAQQAKALQDEIAINNAGILQGKIAAMNAELARNAVTFSVLEGIGQEVLSGIAFKFEEATSAAAKFRNTLRGIGNRLLDIGLSAGLKFGIGALTGNPLSFGSALGAAVGIPGLGGDGGATAAVSAAAEGVVGRSQQLEVKALRIGGGDLLLTLQEAQGRRGTGRHIA